MEDDYVVSLDQAKQISETANKTQSHLSLAMQLDFVNLYGKPILQPTINMIRYDGSLVSGATQKVIRLNPSTSLVSK